MGRRVVIMNEIRPRIYVNKRSKETNQRRDIYKGRGRVK
jgi:hypothetical protein